MQNAAAATAASLQPVEFFPVTVTFPPLNEGERWAGIVSVGTQLHHVILLPGDFEGNWKAAIAWAKEQGGELPTRLEQSLLWAELKDQFIRDWYWSCEPYASDASYAWVQAFDYGSQDYSHVDIGTRARAVRRIPIQ